MIVRIFAVLVLLIYPFAVWQLLERGMIASAALFLAVAALLNACIKRSPIGFVCVACALVLAFCAGVLDMQNALKLYPVFVNAALFTVFAASLRGTPMVETFARLRHKNLPAHAVAASPSCGASFSSSTDLSHSIRRSFAAMPGGPYTMALSATC